MNLSPLFQKKGHFLASLTLIVVFACNKHVSAPLPFKSPIAYVAKNLQPTSFTADWEKVGAVSYNLYIATDSNFTNPLSGYNPMSVKPDSANISGLTTHVDYYYKVVAVDNTGNLSDPSNTIHVRTPDASDDRFVFIGSEDLYMYCFYAGTGDKLWSFKTNGDKTFGDIESSATISQGTLYFNGTDQRLYALDPNNGNKIWNYLTGSAILSSPATGQDLIYLSTYTSGSVFAVNKNGTKKWSVTPAANYRIISSPTYSNGMVYVGSNDKNIYALNSQTGAKVWSAATGDSIVSSPAISNGILYVGSGDKNVYAYDAATGALKWSAPTADSVFSSPTISNGIVYIGSFDNSLYAFDATTGVRKWKTATGGRIQSSPTVSNGVVYVGSFDNKLYAFDAVSGSIKWSTTTGGRIQSSPVVSNGTVYIGNFDNKLYAIDIADGKIKWTAATGGRIRLSSPTVITYPGDVVMPSIIGDVQ